MYHFIGKGVTRAFTAFSAQRAGARRAPFQPLARGKPENDYWHGVLTTSMSVDRVHAIAKDVATTALVDVGLTVEDQGRIWGTAAASILQKPVPLDRSDNDKHTILLELLEPADGRPGVAPLFERVWATLSPSLSSSAQRTSVVLLTGVSGAGKTKVAFDIGRKHAFVVMTRVWEQGLFTAPWRLLKDVTQRLRVQSLKPGALGTEDQSAVAALLLLLSCHFEWAATVFTAAKEAAGRGAIVDERVIREVCLRAQRHGLGQPAVAAQFAHRLKEALVVSDGCASVPIEAALQRLRDVNAAVPFTTPVVWCYDEAQVLLSDHSFDGFFDDTFGPQSVHSNGDQVSQVSPDAPGSDPAAPASSIPAFLALPEDIAAVRCRASSLGYARLVLWAAGGCAPNNAGIPLGPSAVRRKLSAEP